MKLDEKFELNFEILDDFDDLYCHVLVAARDSRVVVQTALSAIESMLGRLWNKTTLRTGTVFYSIV